MEDLAPLIVMMSFAGIVVTAMIISAVKKIRERENRHRERIRALELGVELPPDVDAADAQVVSRLLGQANAGKIGRREDSIGLQGTIWTGVGAGLLAGRFLFGASWTADPDLAEMTGFLTLLALPALFVGLGLVFHAWSIRRRRKEE